MITLLFEAHSTSYDNEAKLASGFNDVDLSPLGRTQAGEMGQRHAHTRLDAIYTSDLQRAYKTAVIAFGPRHIPLFTDARLRECNYGDFTQKDADLVKAMKPNCVTTPFPNGESFTQVCARMHSFLDELASRHTSGQTVLLIGHRGTQYGIETYLQGKSVTDAVNAPWQWQPGWHYVFKRRSGL